MRSKSLLSPAVGSAHYTCFFTSSHPSFDREDETCWVLRVVAEPGVEHSLAVGEEVAPPEAGLVD
jgi:hypothetical protein